MSDKPASEGYLAKVRPTEAELNLIEAVRKQPGFAVVDCSTMTIYPCKAPQYLNGRRPAATFRWPDQADVDTA